MICASAVFGTVVELRATITIMTYLSILCATLAVTSAQMYPQTMEAPRRESETIIHNKNVNIIVNMDPEEVAKELWKVIETRLNNVTSHLASSKSTISELEKTVIPLMSTSRRGATSVSAYEVANEFDRITRRALTRDAPAINTMDEEIMTRDIVADMMVTLKMLLSKTIQSTINEADAVPSRRMQIPAATDNEQDDYVDVRIKIHRKDIINAFH